MGEKSYEFPKDAGNINKELLAANSAIRLKFIIKTDTYTNATLISIESLLNQVPPMSEAIFIISGDGLLGLLYEETVGFLNGRGIKALGIRNYRPNQSFALKQHLSDFTLLYLENASNECLTTDSYKGVNFLIIYHCPGLSYLNFAQHLVTIPKISRLHYYTAIAEEFERIRYFLRVGNLVEFLRLQYKNGENEITYDGRFTGKGQVHTMALTATNMDRMILEQITVDDLSDEKCTPEESVFDGSKHVSESAIETPSVVNSDNDDLSDEEAPDFDLGGNEEDDEPAPDDLIVTLNVDGNTGDGEAAYNVIVPSIVIGHSDDDQSVSNGGHDPISAPNSLFEGISEDGLLARGKHIILRNNFLSVDTITFTAFNGADQCDILLAFLKKLKHSLRQITINVTGENGAEIMNILWLKIGPSLGKWVQVDIYTDGKTTSAGDEILVSDNSTRGNIQSMSGMFYKPSSLFEYLEVNLGNATDESARQYGSGLLAVKSASEMKIYGDDRKTFYYIYEELREEKPGLSDAEAYWPFLVTLTIEYDDFITLDLSVISRNREFLFGVKFLSGNKHSSDELTKFGGNVAECRYLENEDRNKSALSCIFLKNK